MAIREETQNRPSPESPERGDGCLPLLAEIGKSQCCGGLIFAFFADTDRNQHDDGHHVRKHFDQCLGTASKPRNVEVRDVKSAEQEGAEDAGCRIPQGEDDQRNGKPAAVAEAVARPHLGVVHNVVQSAQPRNGAADAGGQVLIARDVDARRVRRCRALAHRAQVQSHLCALEHECRDQRNDNGEVRQEPVGEEHLPEPAQILCKRQARAEIVAGAREGDVRLVTARNTDQRSAQKHSHARAEGGQRQTRDVLIGAQGDGQEAVDQRHQRRSDQGADKRNQHRDNGNHPVPHRLLVKERADHAADAADIHDAGNAEVQVSALFGDDLPRRSEQQRNPLPDGALDKCDNGCQHCLRLLLPGTKIQPVIDEKFAPDDEEQNDTGQDVRKRGIQLECGGNLPRAPLQEDDQQCRKNHGDRVELAQPRHHDCRKALSARRVCRHRMADAAHQQKARYAAERAGEHHGADDDLFDIDPDIPRGVLALAHDRDLISVLAVLQIDVEQNRQHGNNDDRQKRFVPKQRGEPALLGHQVDNADGPRSLRRLPFGHQERDELHGNVVHHQGKQRLVGVPPGAENRGDHRPQHAHGNRCRQHQRNDRRIREHSRQIDHARRTANAARQHLPLGTRIPEAHPERRRHRKGDAQKNCHAAHGDPRLGLRAERTLKHRAVDIQRIQIGHQHRQHPADHQRRQNCNAPDDPRVPPRQGCPLGDVKERLPHLPFSCFNHCHSPSLPRFWSSADRSALWSRFCRPQCRSRVRSR